MKGKWNAEEAELTFGTVLCGKSLKPTWWCAKKEGERLECIKINQHDQEFFIYNGDGSGYRKAVLGNGVFTEYHASIPVDNPKSFIEEINNKPAVFPVDLGKALDSLNKAAPKPS